MLDASKTDGSVVEFDPYDKDNFCEYNSDTGEVTLKKDSKALFAVKGGQGGYGDAVKLEVYIWLEGCDGDCIDNIGPSVLTDIALHFAGYVAEEATD